MYPHLSAVVLDSDTPGLVPARQLTYLSDLPLRLLDAVVWSVEDLRGHDLVHVLALKERVQLPLSVRHPGQPPAFHRGKVPDDEATRLLDVEQLSQVLTQRVVRPPIARSPILLPYLQGVREVRRLRRQTLEVLHLHPDARGTERLPSSDVHVLPSETVVVTDHPLDDVQLIEAGATEQLLGVQHVQHLLLVL